MKTEQLIELLASRVTPVRPDEVRLRFFRVIGMGLIVGVIAMLASLGPRPDLFAAMSLPMFWWKLAFPAAVAVCAFVGLRRLGHPGVRLGVIPLLSVTPFLLMWTASVAILMSNAPADRPALLLGESGLTCTLLILLLSLPASAASILAVRALAPTRPALTGAFAGLFAGACAAFVYALHCTEMQLPFLGAWYALGMLLPAAASAVLAPRVLRW